MTVVFVSKTDALELIEVELLAEPIPDTEEPGRVLNCRYRPYGVESASVSAPEPEPEPEPKKRPLIRRKKKAEVVEPESLVEEPEDDGWTYTTLGHLRREYRPLDGMHMKALISPPEEVV